MNHCNQTKRKIAILSLGRSHLLNLARILDKKEDMEVTFYTMMPESRCRKFGYTGKVVSFLFPIGFGEVIISRIPKINAYLRSHLRFTLRRLFDTLVSIWLKKCDIFIALNGCSNKSSLKAKKQNAIVICDQGSSHINTQNTVHYSYSDVPISKCSTEFMLRHYEVSDYLMVPSEYVKDSDIKNGIETRRILSNPYGVNLKVFQPTDNPKAHENTYDVIMVGSWWKHKGCDMLLEVCVNRLSLRLLHVGSVVDCPLPSTPLFTHIDSVPEAELPKYYSKAKIFVMCSLDEGFGLVLLQAAACGLPVVGSRRTGLTSMANLLKDSKYCIEIKEPLNLDNIETAIRDALEIAEEMPVGKRMPHRANIENISWEAYGERYYEQLNKLLDE